MTTLITGHQEDIAAIEAQASEPVSKEDMAKFCLDNIKAVLDDSFQDFFDSKQSDEQKIIRIKAYIKKYGF